MIGKLLIKSIVVTVVLTVALACRQTSTVDRGGVATEMPAIIATSGEETSRAIASTEVPLPATSTDVAALTDRLIPNDPYFALQWGLDAVMVPEAWRITTGESNIVIAILAGGVDTEHPDLKSKIVIDYDLPNNVAVPEDQLSFGTVLAGIAAASTNNSSGIAGISWEAKVLPVNILDSEGRSGPDLVAEGVLYAVEKDADIIVIPLEFALPSQLLFDSLRWATAMGVVVIISISPGGGDSVPTGTPGILAVCGLSRAEINEARLDSTIDPTAEASESSFICAPAEEGAGTYPGANYAPWGHKYLATGYVAGVAALAWSVNPELTAAEIKDLLLASASDLGPSGYDSRYGAGLLNAQEAVMMALSKALSSDTGEETP